MSNDTISQEQSSSHETHAAVHTYSAQRRTPRQHRRVVLRGTERFDADGVKLEPSDMRSSAQRASDDDKRILGELPPHWAVFNERK